MDVEVSKENICINKLIVEKKELIFVHNDMIVPDAKPDILNTVNVAGNVCIYKKEVAENKIKIDGSVNTYIMYLPDSKEDNLRGLNCNLDFSESISVPGCKEGMILFTKATIKDLECKVINGRKISVKAGIEFDIKIYSNEDVEIINTINNILDIQMLQQDFNVNSLIGNGKTTVYAKETLNIEQKDELAEILKVDTNFVDCDMKISYNKILAKSELVVKIMYLTEDNRIGNIVGKLPIVGFIDMQNIAEDNMCDINYEIKNMLVKPNSADEHSIYVEFEIETSCMAYEAKRLNLIQDLYSPTINLEFTQKKITTSSSQQEKVKEETIRQNVKIEGLEQSNLIDVEAVPILANTTISNSNINYVGEIELNFIYLNSNNINSRNTKIPFEISVENILQTENINVETSITIENSSFNISQTESVDCNIDVRTNAKLSRNIEMNIIDNIEVMEDESRSEEDYDSLIIYIVNSGDTLWQIAKKFNSTVDEISRMNGIEDSNNITVGQKLYIPKFNYIREENAKQPVNV